MNSGSYFFCLYYGNGSYLPCSGGIRLHFLIPPQPPETVAGTGSPAIFLTKNEKVRLDFCF